MRDVKFDNPEILKYLFDMALIYSEKTFGGRSNFARLTGVNRVLGIVFRRQIS